MTQTYGGNGGSIFYLRNSVFWKLLLSRRGNADLSNYQNFKFETYASKNQNVQLADLDVLCLINNERKLVVESRLNPLTVSQLRQHNKISRAYVPHYRRKDLILRKGTW
jgi:hypothetical protein